MKKRTLSRICMVVCFAVAIAAVCIQLSLITELYGNAKAIESLSSQVEAAKSRGYVLDGDIASMASDQYIRDNIYDMDLHLVEAESTNSYLVSLPQDGVGGTVLENTEAQNEG